MKLHVSALIFALCSPAGFALAQTPSTASSQVTQQAEEQNDGDAAPALRRSNRMDFDGRLIKGEKAKGSVYLFQRAQRRLPPLLKLERDGINRIVYPVLRRNADPAASTPAVGATTTQPKGVKAKAEEPKVTPKKTKKARKKRSWRRTRKPKKVKKK